MVHVVEVELLDHVTIPHASSADAPPLMFSHWLYWPRLPVPSQTTDSFDAVTVILGGVLSCKLMVCVHVAIFPDRSDIWYVRVITELQEVVPLTTSLTQAKFSGTTGQLSLAEPPPFVKSEYTV